jgi:hypothetical protein
LILILLSTTEIVVAFAGYNHHRRSNLYSQSSYGTKEIVPNQYVTKIQSIERTCDVSTLFATTTTRRRSNTSSTTILYATPTMKGSGSNPIRNKKKIAVIGCGGYTGALIFGFLQRCSALSYQTGIVAPRCIGATADTSIRLNRFLSRHFCLAQADESYIQLTNLMNVQDIQKKLKGYDAIIFGIDNLFFQSRTVTGNTYEKSPNDKAYVLMEFFLLHVSHILLG